VFTGCSTINLSNSEKSTIENGEFTSTDMYARLIPGSGAGACEAARRALLSQGYVIKEVSATKVNGLKNFQPDTDRHVQIEFHVVCEENSKGSNSATAFANAIRDTYALKKSSNSASIGVGALGSLSLPFGTTDDSLVKVGSETIHSRQFYDRFFEVVERYADVSPPTEVSGTTE
jgi:hypothetical protein